MEKSPEAFRTISEVAELLEIPAHVLRFWESRFPQIRPVKRAGGRRYYRPADVALLSGIRRLLHDEGMTIRGVQKILREKGVRHVAGLTEEPEVEAIELQSEPADAVATEAEIIQLSDRVTAEAAAPRATADSPDAEDAGISPVMAEDSGHWPADPSEDDQPELAPDADLPAPWSADPEAPEPEPASMREPEPEGQPLILSAGNEAAEGGEEPATALPPALPDVPFDPRIEDAPFHIPTRLRGLTADRMADRAPRLAVLHTRLQALRSTLSERSGKNRS
ncbi:MerR family transcriptional regulator [Aliigemmobacter aestuarii]|uniref:MerR family transcriptional regulator n=1 Tax=Aliigemmobacter aestuarii TaxID=1445661 RepID=A0A4S3MNM3_9RHOB|nr:MerR family transcriptional regulator [Gemmobacter aestuarii]THD83143.1 MerR family transcriptional regulator [Gemmobacter aestuarii]